MSDHRDLAVGMVVLTHVERAVKPALSALRSRANDANEGLRHRETVVAVSPVDGTELGHITRTNPEKVAQVEDMAVLMAHLQEVNPDALYDAEYIPANVPDESVFAVLRKHAPELLDSEPRIREQELAHLLRQSEKDGKPVAPGIKLDKPNGTTNVYPAKNQAAAIEAVIRSGCVQLDGAVVLPQIEGVRDGSQDA